MIYAMSDLHGCYDKYLRMLKRIDLKPEDTLYILGDVVDRGPDGVKILLDICERKNIVFLRGNHDDTAMKVIRYMFDPSEMFNEDKLVPMIESWVSDGGNTTLSQFLSLSSEEKEKALLYLWNSKFYLEIEVKGNKYLLAHTVPEKEIMLNPDELEYEDFIWGEPDYDLQYFDDKIIVTGHTPTGFIDKEYNGRIYVKNNHIAIDCGAVFGKKLACIRLDDMQEFYV